MQTEQRTRFIQKIKIISNVLRGELQAKEILSPSEEPILTEIVNKFDDLHKKMSAEV